MAFWVRRGKKQAVYVYSFLEKRQIVLPRKETKHLDALPDDMIEQWVKQYETQYEGRTAQPQNLIVSGDKIYKLLQSFIDYMKEAYNLSPTTLREYYGTLYNYPLQFLASHGIHNKPQKWHLFTVQLSAWLRERDANGLIIRRSNRVLDKFYTYVCEELNLPRFQLKLRTIALPQKETPLRKLLTPQDVLRFCQARNGDAVALFALLTYFGSLRPQETLALTFGAFKAGSVIASLPCVITMKKMGLYHKLAMFITHQIDEYNTVKKTKTAGSKAWVCVFNEDAAKMVVGVLRDRKLGKDDKLFDIGISGFRRVWKKQGIGGVGLKDLRRASIHWLGFNSPLGESPIALQKHARHSCISTTLLYCRRPEDNIESSMELDLEA
jgi:site-specific recombinase XerD